MREGEGDKTGDMSYDWSPLLKSSLVIGFVYNIDGIRIDDVIPLFNSFQSVIKSNSDLSE